MPDFDKMKKQTRSGGGPFNMKSYGAGKNPISRKGKINPNSEGNTDLKDGRSKSSTFQKNSTTKMVLKHFTTSERHH